MRAVFRHELAISSHSLTAYAFAAFLLVFTGVGALIYNINASVANFEYVLSFVSVVYVVLVPLLTMRTVAEERRQKTDQLLYSLPVSTADIVAGKFFALAVVLALPILLICIYPLIFAQFGDVYLPTSYGTISAFYLLGLALISTGMFVSSLTESQGMAAGGCLALLIFNYFSTDLTDYVTSTSVGTLICAVVLVALLALLVRALTKSDFIAWGIAVLGTAVAAVVYVINSALLEGLIPKVMETLSLFDRLQTFVNGVYDLKAVVFYLSVTVFFLFLCVQSLEKRRYNG